MYNKQRSNREETRESEKAGRRWKTKQIMVRNKEWKQGPEGESETFIENQLKTLNSPSAIMIHKGFVYSTRNNF